MLGIHIRNRHAWRRPALPWLVLAAALWGIGVIAMYGVTRVNSYVEPRGVETDTPLDTRVVPAETERPPVGGDGAR